MSNKSMDIVSAAADREKTIVKVSVISIIMNVLLGGFKAVIGLTANSISIVVDAVNNLSDALSSVITIIGAKLGSKEPDKKHPLGYGRMEYLSSLIVSVIVLYAGVTALIEAVEAIITPEDPDYGIVSIIILIVSVIAKLIVGRYMKTQGQNVNSGALVASGSEALFDALLSLAVLVSAVIYMFFGVSLEAIVSVLISIYIIKAGIELLVETLNDIIGQREDAETTEKVRALLAEEEAVQGVYDLVLFNYGPNRYFGSAHLELPDTMTVEEADRLTRRCQLKVYREAGVVLTGIGVYSYNTKDDEAAHMRNAVQQTVMSHDWALQMHGFYVDSEEKCIRFDVVVSFETDRIEAVETIKQEVEALYPDYEVQIVPDVDLSD